MAEGGDSRTARLPHYIPADYDYNCAIYDEDSVAMTVASTRKPTFLQQAR